jgi:hypothetical protein
MSLPQHRGWVAEPPPGGPVWLGLRLGMDGDAVHEAPVTAKAQNPASPLGRGLITINKAITPLDHVGWVILI